MKYARVTTIEVFEPVIVGGEDYHWVPMIDGPPTTTMKVTWSKVTFDEDTDEAILEELDPGVARQLEHRYKGLPPSRSK